VNKLLIIFLFFFFNLNFSINSEAAFWNKNKKIKPKIIEPKELFKDEFKLKKEFNSNIKIQLNSTPLKDSFLNNLTNNNGRLNYDGELQILKKFKFSSISNFDQIEPEVIFDQYGVIFYDKKGTIIKFNDTAKLIWKKNFYKKKDKKLKPNLSFGANKETLIIADNLANYYAVNLDNGELNWKRKNNSPFNSQIKIYKNNFFIIDFENIIRCYSIKNGDELWNHKTDTTFIKSQKKLSIVISDNKVIFNNSIGDISALDIETGALIWQTPTQDSSIYESAFLLKTSDLTLKDEKIFFSNNKNQFFSIDKNTGFLNWEQKINSNLRPTIIDNLIFTITIEGFLVLIDSNSGDIIRITNVFEQIKKRKRPFIKPVGFVVGKNNIYLTLDNGRLIVVDISTGKSSSILKFDNEKISRPFFSDQNLFIIRNNSILKLN